MKALTERGAEDKLWRKLRELGVWHVVYDRKWLDEGGRWHIEGKAYTEDGYFRFCYIITKYVVAPCGGD